MFDLHLAGGLKHNSKLIIMCLICTISTLWGDFVSAQTLCKNTVYNQSYFSLLEFAQVGKKYTYCKKQTLSVSCYWHFDNGWSEREVGHSLQTFTTDFMTLNLEHQHPALNICQKGKQTRQCQVQLSHHSPLIHCLL